MGEYILRLKREGKVPPLSGRAADIWPEASAIESGSFFHSHTALSRVQSKSL